MALPVGLPPKPNDIAWTGWSGITTRIAWTLLSMGVKVRPRVLSDARVHVLYHLSPSTPLPAAEDRAGILTTRFVHRARGDHADDPWPQDAEMPLSPRWRRSLDKALTPLSRVVFAQHYGNARPLVHLERVLQVDPLALNTARSGLREVIRAAGVEDGLPFDTWENERLDRLLGRLATYAPGPCPPVLEVIEGCHRDHLSGCSRCERTLRLVKAGVLDVEDLVPPTLGARPRGEAKVLALHFHPEAREQRAELVEELEAACFPVGDDLLLVDWEQSARVTETLVLAAEVGAPSREHVRGCTLTGPGTWSSHGLLGPLTDRAAVQVRGCSWGEVESLGELPAPLPAPPSARWAWALVAVLALVALVSGVRILPAIGAPPPAVQVEFTPARGGFWTVFDAPELRHVSVFRAEDGTVEPVLVSTSAADKARYAVGDGSYRLHTIGQGVLVAVTDEPIHWPMDGSVAQLDRVAEQISRIHPDATLRLQTR